MTTKAKNMKKHIDVAEQIEKNTRPIDHEEVLSGWQLFVKATILSLGITTVFLLITAVVLIGIGWSKLNTFLQYADISLSELKQDIQLGIDSTEYENKDTIVFLLLGLDSLQTRPGSPELTDTMLYAVVNTKTGTITTVPLPRDLWSEEYQTKINALYHYGKDRYSDAPQTFSQEVLDALSGLTTTHTVVVTMDTVAEIIDILGGITVDVPAGFTDTEFPRTDVDVTKVTDPKLLYETITFTTGLEHMSGKRALQYIRSRKSSDDQGTDLARGHRQQLVLESMLQTLQTREVLTNPVIMGTLFAFYNSQVGHYIPVENVVAMAKKMYPVKNSIQFKNLTLTVYPEDTYGVLTNPPLSKHKQWVYEIKDQKAFSDFFATVLTR